MVCTCSFSLSRSVPEKSRMPVAGLVYLQVILTGTFLILGNTLAPSNTLFATMQKLP